MYVCVGVYVSVSLLLCCLPCLYVMCSMWLLFAVVSWFVGVVLFVVCCVRALCVVVCCCVCVGVFCLV